MAITHDLLVWFAKSYGLFYLIGMSVAVLIYVWWPANRKTFDDAAGSVLHEEDKPWR